MCFGAGDHFAEVPVFDGKPFPASAAALEPTETLFFSTGVLFFGFAGAAPFPDHQHVEGVCPPSPAIFAAGG